MELNDLVTSLMAQLYRVSKSESVVGKPMVFGESAVVPLCKITVGFGTGSTDVAGEQRAKGGSFDVGGAGGGIAVEPRAFVVVGKQGTAQMLSVRKGAKAILQKAVDVLPHAVDQVLPVEEEKRMGASRLRIIVTGLVGLYPVGGVAWDYLQYVVGFARMGHDVYYHEDTWSWPYHPLEKTYTEDPG